MSLVFWALCGYMCRSLKAAAAAMLLQSCPTLCDPIDGSPPGSPFPGILQARTLEWVAISFSSAWKWKVKVKSLSRVRPSATPWTAARLLCPRDFPGKSTGVGCHCLLWRRTDSWKRLWCWERLLHPLKWSIYLPKNLFHQFPWSTHCLTFHP